MSENIELPRILVSFKKYYLASFTDSYIHLLISNVAGQFIPFSNIIILSYGDFAEGLLKKYNRTIEKQVCNTISHEIIHWWLFNETNIKVCAKFDDIAESLAEYGVY